MNIRIVWLAFVLFVLSVGISAQEKPQMLLVYEEMVQPSQLDAYIESSKEFGELMMAADPAAEWQVVMLEDFNFYWVIPISSFGEIDEMQASMMKMIEKTGMEKFTKMMEASSKTTDHVNSFVVVRRNDLSYHPDTMVPLEETKVLEYSYYYLKPGMDFAAEEVAKAYAAMAKEKGVESGYTIYQLTLGADMPGLAVVVPARSLDELQSINSAYMEKMGADGETLQKKANAITRRFDRRIGFTRPDLGSSAFKEPAK